MSVCTGVPNLNNGQCWVNAAALVPYSAPPAAKSGASSAAGSLAALALALLAVAAAAAF